MQISSEDECRGEVSVFMVLTWTERGLRLVLVGFGMCQETYIL